MGETSKQDFEALIGPYFQALFRAAYRLTGNRPDAEDLVQEVCLRAYPKLGQLRSLDYPMGWLLKVQYRLFVDQVRHRDRSPLQPMPEDADGSTVMMSRDPAPEELADGSLTGQHLQAAWSGLERDQRALLALKVEGYGLGEIEQITEIPVDAIKARLYRARVRLGKLLTKQQNESPRVSQSES